MLIGIAFANRLPPTTVANVASFAHLPVCGIQAVFNTTRNVKRRRVWNTQLDACGKIRKHQLVKPSAGGASQEAACLSYIISESAFSFDQTGTRSRTSTVDHSREVVTSSSFRSGSHRSHRQATEAREQRAGTTLSSGTPKFDLTLEFSEGEGELCQSPANLTTIPDLLKNQEFLQLVYLPHLRYVIIVSCNGLSSEGPESASGKELVVTPPTKANCSQPSEVAGESDEEKDVDRKSKRLESLLLLNILAAIYGTGTVVSRSLAEGASSATPASLSSLVRYVAALVFFLPALGEALGTRDSRLIKAGAELGGYLFAETFFSSLSQGSKNAAWDSSPLLFAVSVIFVPLMEIRAGKSVSKITWLATLAALSGMGLLEEDGSGWKGISLPQLPQPENLWSVAASLTSALHIWRSEAIGSKFDSRLLTSLQLLVLTLLSLLWEVATLCGTGSTAHLVQDVGSISWGPVLYGGLVCTGLCSWLELRGLRWVHASTATLIYTTIPLWGALFAFLLRSETLLETAAVAAQLVVVAGFVSRWLATHHDSLLRAPRRNASADHLPGAFLSSQLKFPFYAAQAQKLITEAKMNVGAIKGMLMSCGLATAGKTSDLAGSPPSGLVGTTAHSADHLAQAAAAAVHGTQLADLAASVMVGMASGLDLVAVAVGSDLMQALGDAEDAASFLCNVLGDACATVSHVLVGYMDVMHRLAAQAAASTL